MAPGDCVEIPQGSSPPLDGLVVRVGDSVHVKLDICDSQTQILHPNCLRNVSLLPRIHVEHILWLPRNMNTTVLAQPQNKIPNTFTGRSPWVGMEIKVIGTEHNKIPQMHKGDVGRVLDVSTDLSTKSGLAVLVCFDAPSSSPDTPIAFDHICRQDNSGFLAYTIDAQSCLQFKTGYCPVHSREELYSFYGHPQKLINEQNAWFVALQEKYKAEDKAKIEQERLAILAQAKCCLDLHFVKGGAPLTLQAGTPPPKMD